MPGSMISPADHRLRIIAADHRLPTSADRLDRKTRSTHRTSSRPRLSGETFSRG
jgi:hypothetical protein